VGPSILVLSHDCSVFCSLDSKVCFPSILDQIHIFEGTCGIDIILNKYACKEC
jgi:hypothetical protein